MARIFAYIVHKSGVADDTAAELPVAARKIDPTEPCTAVVTGWGADLENVCESLRASYSEIWKIANEPLAYPNAELVRKALLAVLPAGAIVLVPHGHFGVDLSPGLSIKMNAAYAPDVLDIEGIEGTWLKAVRQEFGRYIDDPAFVRRMMPGVRDVLGFFESYQKTGGSLGPLPWWRYMDWVDAWPNGDAPQEPDGSSAPFDFLYVMGLNWAADLEAVFGAQAFSAYYRQQAATLGAAFQSLYWDAGRRLYADTPRKANWSQHANVLAVLSGVAPANMAADLTMRVLKDTTLAPCSLYFRHYLYTALNRAGEGDRYLPELADWYTMIDKYGLTTFSEVLDKPGKPSRSDCHGWSASPNYELLHTVLGVDSAAPHFGRVLIRPFLGELQRASGSVPHPKGAIAVTLERFGAALRARSE